MPKVERGDVRVTIFFSRLKEGFRGLKALQYALEVITKVF